MLTADEEAGAEHGAKWLCEQHPDVVRCDLVVNEGAGQVFEYEGRRIYGVCVAEKGVFRFTLTTHGRAGHVGVASGHPAGVDPQGEDNAGDGDGREGGGDQQVGPSGHAQVSGVGPGVSGQVCRPQVTSGLGSRICRATSPRRRTGRGQEK